MSRTIAREYGSANWCTWLAITVLSCGALPSTVAAADPVYHVTTFSADVTPPIGSPLCAGFVKPTAGVSEPLQALGLVIFGAGDPIVLCAVDWCEIRNRDHQIWREQLAKAAGTTPERVAVQSLHQHNAPLADTIADDVLRAAKSPYRIQDTKWMDVALAGVAKAVR